MRHRLALPVLLGSARREARPLEGRDIDLDSRFELFHSATSLQSHEVRAVLEFKAVPWCSRDIDWPQTAAAGSDAFIPGGYRPSYVRLRTAAQALERANEPSGLTPAALEIEPFAVPTLVDHQTEQVLADPERMIEHIERAVPERRLHPVTPVAARTVRHHVQMLRQIPHGTLLACTPLDDIVTEDLRDWVRRGRSDGVAVLRGLMAENAAEPAMRDAYRAELERVENRHTDGASLYAQAREDTAGILDNLERNLVLYGTLTHGAGITLADLLWEVSLSRLRDIDLSHLWAALPRVQQYREWLDAIPAMRGEEAKLGPRGGGSGTSTAPRRLEDA